MPRYEFPPDVLEYIMKLEKRVEALEKLQRGASGFTVGNGTNSSGLFFVGQSAGVTFPAGTHGQLYATPAGILHWKGPTTDTAVAGP